MDTPDLSPPTRRRRLQRDEDFTGARLTSFRQVFLRHGLPGMALALVCLAVPSLQGVLSEHLMPAAAHPARYAAAFALIFLILNAYAWFVDRSWSVAKLGWVVYLGALSLWEEWVFRLALPQTLEGVGASVWAAAGLSALVFGAAHFFTLRWKWYWCVGAALGGLYFSVQIETRHDLLWVTAVHWIATYVNTPRPPGCSSARETNV